MKKYIYIEGFFYILDKNNFITPHNNSGAQYTIS